MGRNYCGGRIMGAVVAEEGKGGQQSSKLHLGLFSLSLFHSYINCSIELCMYVGNNKFELTPYLESQIACRSFMIEPVTHSAELPVPSFMLLLC